ncbi:MAG: sarcosine oxidase subunit alpha [Proteobacteria bacterium]|nr:sarcosine oxidase subunit alpha [Pseudomonadota bacterium]
MTQKFRLPEGGRINRDRPARFQFDGVTYHGYEGDTLASALLANGVHLMGRSFKYHRPRGVLSAGAEEPSALVQLREGARTEPNMRATMVELFDGLKAESQNRWPSLSFDIWSVNNLFSRFLPSGFYYKTFMWPASLWMSYERFIRNAAGLGKGPEGKDPDRYEQRHQWCDVLVAGGGPAGLMAALTAGRAGARVILAEDQSEMGGSLLSDTVEIDGKPAADWLAGIMDELNAMEEVTILPRTTVSGYYDYNFLTLLERITDHLGAEPDGKTPRQRFWQVRAKQVVLATGAIERPLTFLNNDRPGVMLAGAARTYVNRHAALPGRKAVIFTNNDSAYNTAIDLQRAGASAIVVDVRKAPRGALVEAARAAGIEIRDGQAIVKVNGGKRVTGVVVRALSEDGKTVSGGSRSIRCDLVAMSGGWNPTVHLFSQSRGKLRFDDRLSAFVPDKSFADGRSAGACNGSMKLIDCLTEGRTAGLAAARDAGFETKKTPATPKVDEADEGGLMPVWVVPSGKRLGQGGKHFIDFQNDVTAADVHLAHREGYVSVEHLKRYTTMGMGTDQGKTSNVNALAIMAGLQGVSIPEAGTTTFRPPYTPTSFGAIAGRNVGEFMDPARLTAMHDWHVEQGAAFEDVGQWKRPWYYPINGENMHDAVNREVLAARSAVTMLDASTLGKIDIQGPDAAEFLNRIYTNAWLKLPVGSCRYGLMLQEDGMVFDDGVTTRLGENRFLMTTTTGGAANVLTWLEEWLQTEWPELKVYCTSVTEQWSTISVSGPYARHVVGSLTDYDKLGPRDLPFMTMAEMDVAGMPARVYRISFTGELAFEVNVPRRYGLALWRAIWEAGRKYGITPYGTEAMHVLRAEKGFIIVGQETDGTVTPMDMGMDWIVSKKKGDFIGRRSFAREDTTRDDRKQLVGLFTEDEPHHVLIEGQQLVEQVMPAPPMKMVGHVTSAYFSPNVGRSIALAVVKGGRERMGETLYAPRLDGGKPVKVTITDPVFFDKEGVRARG